MQRDVKTGEARGAEPTSVRRFMYIHLSFSAPKVRRRVRSPLAGKRLLEFSCGEPRVTAAKGRGGLLRRPLPCGFPTHRIHGNFHTDLYTFFL